MSMPKGTKRKQNDEDEKLEFCYYTAIFCVIIRCFALVESLFTLNGTNFMLLLKKFIEDERKKM